MKRRLIPTIVFSVLLLAVVIAAGVHILHKQAYADEITYKVYAFDDVNEDPVEIDDFIWFRFWRNNEWTDWEPPDSQIDGWYKLTTEQAEHWQAIIADWRWIPVNPDESPYQPPDTWNQFNWKVHNWWPGE
ncbi:MAG: hypothetical protein FJY65_09975 [Calditrichaeota bacterium]|nr:hypothetical protein [Calditrichota bacterium]